MADEKVLLVDDEEDFAEALSMRLEARGVQVVVANDGATAQQKAAEQRFDAIVLDLAMPGMNGIDTLRALRESQENVQVILLTGRATVANGIEAMKLGALDFLEKPVQLDLLLDKIHEAKSRGDELEEQRTKKLIHDIITTKGW